MRILKPVRGRQHEVIDFDLHEELDANFEQDNPGLAQFVEMVMADFDQSAGIDGEPQLDP